jgi:DNA processing protein
MEDLLYKIALSLINTVGPITAKSIVSYCGSPEAVFQQNRRSLMKIPGVGPKTADEILDPDVMRRAEKEMDYLNRNGIRSFFYLDPEYPGRLKPYSDSPVILYYQGTDVLNHFRSIGIVGTRQPSERGKQWCEQIIEGLRPYQPLVISGLAYGVDAVAHRKSVEAGLPTIGVMGHGIARMYPAGHQGLRQRMMEKGGVLTEFPAHTKPEREHFPMRNRIIAALSDALLVVESGRKGGSMITAQFGFAYNKDVFAIPGRPGDELSAGPNFLIKSQVAALVENAEDIAQKMLWEMRKPNAANAQLQLFSQLDDEELRIVNIIRDAEEANPTVDYIHYESKMSLSALSVQLLSLELKNVVRSLPGSRYRLV